MFFRNEMRKRRHPYAKVAIKDAEEFNKTMRRLDSNVYVCLVNLVGNLDYIRLDSATCPKVYSKYADLGLIKEANRLPVYRLQNLLINIKEGQCPPY